MSGNPSRARAFFSAAFGMATKDREAVERVKKWARHALSGDPDTAFAVNEIVCADPACPGTETVILVMEPRVKTRACKIAKALSDVSERDVADAFAPQGDEAWPASPES